MRGFEGNTLGPRDSQGEALGANARIAGQMELLFPPPGDTFEDSMRFGLFLDVGNVFDLSGGGQIDTDEFRASAGVMLSWLSPVGPLSFSLGYPVKKQDDDSTEVFQFNIGAGF